MEQVESVKGEMPEPLWNRCRYVVEENHRVLEAADALLASDMEKLGGLLSASHEGLRHQYEVSCPELDFLADTALSLPGVLGARMMGGGFGGCTLNLVHEDALKAVSSALTKAYRKGFGRDAAPFEVTPGDGVRLLP
jgi:galactokinase